MARVSFAEFANRFVSTYAVANNRPSEVNATKAMLALHLKPFFGKKWLCDIGSEHIEAYKAHKLDEEFAPKSVHNHLTCLSRLSRIAVEWGVLEKAPVIRPLYLPKPKFDFFDFAEATRLLEAVGTKGQLATMLVVDLNVGIRIGEMRALRWTDVDLVAGKLVVRHSVYRANPIGTPKGGREREMPLNQRTVQALRPHRHLRGEVATAATAK